MINEPTRPVPAHAAKRPPAWFVIGFTVFIALVVGGCVAGCLAFVL